MKKLTTPDLFKAMRVIKAAGVRDALKPLMKKIEQNGANLNVADVGIDTILVLMESVSGTEAEDAFYDFLAAPFEMTVADIKSLDIGTMLDKLKELSEVNDLRGFFKQLSGSIT